MEMTNYLSAQMNLMGNIIRNLSLLDDYGDSLMAEDFGDPSMREMFLFLKFYYKEYGTEVNVEKMGIAYLDYAEQSKKFRDYFKARTFYAETIKVLAALGDDGVRADNISYRRVKRFSTYEHLKSKGIEVDKFMSEDELEKASAEDMLTSVSNVVEGLEKRITVGKAVEWSDGVEVRAMNLLSKPEYGFQTPFSFINYFMHGLCRNDLTMIGGLSNSGKGRFLMNLLVYLCCVEGQNVYYLSNEMTSEDMFKAFLCTLCNMRALRALHGVELRISQETITQVNFVDENGEIIQRMDNEAESDYIERLTERSREFRDYKSVLRWYDNECKGRVFFVNVMDDYSPERIKKEVHKAESNGCTVVAYDTLKGYRSSEWGEIVQAATSFSEAIKCSTGLHGIATFQLTDDAAYCKLEELDNTKIAGGKHILHVADSMLMFKQLNEKQKEYYGIPEEKNVAAFKIVKNRRGSGKDKIFAVQNNLDFNCWEYICELAS